jgi:hypothetical protein
MVSRWRHVLDVFVVAILAWLVGGERLTPLQFLLAILAYSVLGIVLEVRERRRARAARSPEDVARAIANKPNPPRSWQ